jgi:hypothetical protein
MRQRVSKESHAAQDNVRADDRAEDPDQDRRDHPALDEFILKRLKKERHNQSGGQQSSTSMVPPESTFKRPP